MEEQWPGAVPPTDEEPLGFAAPCTLPRVEISKRLILVNSASALAAHVLQLSVLVWLQQYLLRRISVDEYSLFPVVSAIMVFVPLLTTALVSGAERYTVEAYAKGDERRVTQITSTLFPLFCALGLLILLLGSFATAYADVFLRIPAGRVWDARLMLGLLMLSTALRVIVTPFGLGLYIRQKFVLSNLIQLATQVLRLIVLFSLMFGVSTRVVWVVVSSVGADLCGLIVNQVLSQRLVPALQFRPSAIRWSTARELASFSAWTFVQQVAWAIRTGTDPLILNRLGTALDVTCYHLGSLASNQVQRATLLVTVPWQPALTAMHAQRDAGALRHAYLRGGRSALWTLLLLTVPLIIYRNELITLYVGSEYLPAAAVMGLLLAVGPFVYGNFMLGKLVTAVGQPRPMAVRALVSQLINLGLTLYLVGAWKMGAVGAALATLLATGLAQPICMWPLGWRVAGVTGGQWLRAAAIPGFAPACAGTALWLVLKLVVQPATWASLGGCVLAGAVVYALVLVAFCLRPYEREDLRRMLAALNLFRRARG